MVKPRYHGHKLSVSQIPYFRYNKQAWFSRINNSSRLSTYCLYKYDFKFEPYQKYVSVNKYRNALTKFRLSAHNLAVKTGRHDGLDRNHRKCAKCLMNILENEYHFLLICPKYLHLRRKFLRPYFCPWPTLQKFENLMSSNNPRELINLSKYLYFAFKEIEQN